MGPDGLLRVDQARLLMKSETALVADVGQVGETPGVIANTWDEDDLDFAGPYEAEIELTRGTIVETVPNDSYFTLNVIENLG